MINIQSLVFRYTEGNFCLEIPAFSLEAGEKVAVIGPSGTGKTTLLNLIAGIFLPEQGSVVIGDQRIDHLSDDQRRDFRIRNIGFIFQDFQLLDYLSMQDNILHPYRISRALHLTADIRQRVKELAEQMGIGDKLTRHANALSQGEQQRAAICRAMLPSPNLILADEATGNLDPENKTHILDLLFEATHQHEASLLAVTHDHDLLSRFDRVVDFRDFQVKA